MVVSEAAIRTEARPPVRAGARQRERAGRAGRADRARLVRILQDAHAGEQAAVHAYRGHARSLRRRRPADGAEIHRIGLAERQHRRWVGEMLADLGVRPRRRRELLMGILGRLFGALCHVSGWFGPMYAAGFLEAMNVDQYRSARDLAAGLGLDHHRDLLEAMRSEEVLHERWFGERVRGHALLPVARRLLGWAPAPDDGSGGR
jgi:demethoxyubiquinone hydroxylase (CLK1/Coq7/Cat5 family)